MPIHTTEDRPQQKQKKQSWLIQCKQLLLPKPKSRKQLLECLYYAKQYQLINTQALTMIEGVLQIADHKVRDIMVPYAKMTVILENTSLNEILPIVIESGHSRFPVIGSNKEIVGLLLAKDLLKYNPLTHQDTFNIHNILRPAVFIPESKRLDSLLEEFQHKHYHMAMIVDEYGAVSGLITIEDVLEEIVGEIEDEYDNSVEIFVKKQTQQQFIVKALMPIEEFNQYFNTEFDTEQFDTIGGFIANRFGYLPKRGTSITLSDLQFKVIRADSRQIRLLQVIVPHPPL